MIKLKIKYGGKEIFNAIKHGIKAPECLYKDTQSRTIATGWTEHFEQFIYNYYL